MNVEMGIEKIPSKPREMILVSDKPQVRVVENMDVNEPGAWMELKNSPDLAVIVLTVEIPLRCPLPVIHHGQNWAVSVVVPDPLR